MNSSSYTKAHRATRTLIEGKIRAHGDEAVRVLIAERIARHDGAMTAVNLAEVLIQSFLRHAIRDGFCK